MAKKERSPIEPKSLADFKKAMEDFAKKAGAEVEMVAREQMRLMCRDAMTFTPPLPKGGGRGLSVGAHNAGLGRVSVDIRRIFIPQDMPVRFKPVLLRQTVNAIRGDDMQQFLRIHLDVTESKLGQVSPVLRKILSDTDIKRSYAKAKNYLNKASINGTYRAVAGLTADIRGVHERYKNKVNGRWPKNAPIGGPQYFVSETVALNAYAADRQQKVGRVKAGWAAAMRKIPKSVSKAGVERNFGAYDAPWVDANIRSAQGGFRGSVTPGKVSMTVLNIIGNVNGVADEAGTENLVYGNRVANLNATLQARAQALVDRANRRD